MDLATRDRRQGKGPSRLDLGILPLQKGALIRVLDTSLTRREVTSAYVQYCAFPEYVPSNSCCGILSS